MPLNLVNSASTHWNINETSRTKELVPVIKQIFKPYGKNLCPRNPLEHLIRKHPPLHRCHIWEVDSAFPAEIACKKQNSSFFSSPSSVFCAEPKLQAEHPQDWELQLHLQIGKHLIPLLTGITLTTRSRNQTSHSWQRISPLRGPVITTSQTKCTHKTRFSGKITQTQTTDCTRPNQ